MITEDVYKKSDAFRSKLNALEVYIKYAVGQIDIQVFDTGIKAARQNISRRNTVEVVSDVRLVLANVKRNRAALKAKGMNPEFVAEVAASVNEIDTLNNTQNSLQNKMTATTSVNIKDYNELWDMITEECEMARVLYKGVDEVKLKQFTLSALAKRKCGRPQQNCNGNTNGVSYRKQNSTSGYWG